MASMDLVGGGGEGLNSLVRIRAAVNALERMCMCACEHLHGSLAVVRDVDGVRNTCRGMSMTLGINSHAGAFGGRDPTV
jgi:hypothetical protein